MTGGGHAGGHGRSRPTTARANANASRPTTASRNPRASVTGPSRPVSAAPGGGRHGHGHARPQSAALSHKSFKSRFSDGNDSDDDDDKSVASGQSVFRARAAHSAAAGGSGAAGQGKGGGGGAAAGGSRVSSYTAAAAAPKVAPRGVSFHANTASAAARNDSAHGDATAKRKQSAMGATLAGADDDDSDDALLQVGAVGAEGRAGSGASFMWRDGQGGYLPARAALLLLRDAWVAWVRCVGGPRLSAYRTLGSPAPNHTTITTLHPTHPPTHCPPTACLPAPGGPQGGSSGGQHDGRRSPAARLWR
jgi:hypothetical protein